MYRIELVPGEVTVFRTIEELATGVRNGLITPKARIYHSASDKWLPIEFHPHYKQALEVASGRAAEPSGAKQPGMKATERPRSEGLTFLNVPISPVTPTSLTMPGSPSVHQTAPRPPQPLPGSDPVASSRAMSDPFSLPWITPKSDTSTHAQAHPLAQARAQPDPVESTSRFAPPPTKPDPVESTSRFAPPGGHATVTRTAQVDPRAIVLYQPDVEESAPEDTVVEESALEEPAVEGVHAFEPVVLRPAPTLPPVSPSPVLELPRISYPEIMPAEAPVAMRASSPKRPLHLAGAILLLAAGGYASTTMLSLGGGNDGFTAASTMADRPVVPIRATAAPAQRASQVAADPLPTRSTSNATPRPAPTPVPAGAPAVHAPTTGVPAVRTSAASVRADSTPLPPASSGFARALEARAIVTTPAKATSGTATDSLADAAPAIDMQVAMPALPGEDSVAAARPKSDSTMKKILRALNGGKTAP